MMMYSNHLIILIWSLICLLGVTLAQVAGPYEAEVVSAWTQYVAEQDFRTIFLDEANSKIYIGAVNKMYEFDSTNVTNTPRMIDWSPANTTRQTCLTFKSHHRVLCENNIRVLQPVNSTHLYACGTMAYMPTCCYIMRKNFTRMGWTDEGGRWKTPNDPYISTVSIMANQTLFTATKHSVDGNNGIISRALNGITLLTQGGDKFWLNDPVFVGGHHDRDGNSAQDKVLVFFREKAEEFQPYLYGLASSPSQRNVASRVASVCVNDHGGSAWVLNRKFATFSKMSIICNTASQDEDASFRYSHLESTYMLEDPSDPFNPTLYGIFTMPSDALAGSAVCAYRMNDVRAAMATNRYWSRLDQSQGATASYNPDHGEVPGMCVEETQTLSRARLTFSKRHPIKFGNIYPSQGRPHYQEPGTRYLHIVVDRRGSESSSLEGDATILYMISDTAHLKRVVHAPSVSEQPWSLPDIKVTEIGTDECVQKMVIGQNFVYVITNRTLIQVPFAACSLYETCHDCNGAMDPYCTWTDGVCRSVFEFGNDSEIPKSNESICGEKAKLVNPDELLIEELRSNLTDLSRQNDETQQSVVNLIGERNKEYEALLECRSLEQERNHTIESQNEQLRDSAARISEAEDRNDALRQDVEVCQGRVTRAWSKATEFSNELKNRPVRAEVDKLIQDLTDLQQQALRASRRCAEELENSTAEMQTCSIRIKTSEDRIEETERRCAIERQNVIDSMDVQMRVMKHTMTQLHHHADGNERECNETLNVSNRKLALCYDQLLDRTIESSQLKKSNTNKSEMIENFKNRQDRSTQLIQQLTWLHKRNGYRGQQNCEHNGWFLSNATGNLFLLGKQRGTFQEANDICEQLSAKLAVFHDADELRYINNVIRAFEPTRHFWIGLVKHTNGTIIWQDDVTLEDGQGRFPHSQQARLNRRSRYCVEMTASQRWNLIPCIRTRRPICQKVINNADDFVTRNVIHIVSKTQRDFEN